MTNNTSAALFVILSLFLCFRGIRIFLRARQTGELIGTAGIIIFVGSYFIQNVTLAIAGFIIFNLGWIYLVTIENDIRKALYRQTTMTQRLSGNIPKIEYNKSSATVYDTASGIITGVICVVLAVILFKKQQTADITDTTFIGMLGFAGGFFVIFSLLKNKIK